MFLNNVLNFKLTDEDVLIDHLILLTDEDIFTDLSTKEKKISQKKNGFLKKKNWFLEKKKIVF